MKKISHRGRESRVQSSFAEASADKNVKSKSFGYAQDRAAVSLRDGFRILGHAKAHLQWMEAGRNIVKSIIVAPSVENGSGMILVVSRTQNSPATINSATPKSCRRLLKSVIVYYLQAAISWRNRRSMTLFFASACSSVLSHFID